MLYYNEYCKRVQNKTIDLIHESRTNAGETIILPRRNGGLEDIHEEIPLFSYVPKYVDTECELVNQIVGQIVNDPHFSWYESKYNGLNCFGISPISASNTVTFSKINTILNTNQRYNCRTLTTGTTRSESPDPLNSVITNLWIEIDNPTHVTLNELVSYIEMHYGGSRVEMYRSNDIETEINVLCYLFKYEAISYKDGKIRIPLIFPYNVPIFLRSHHEFTITVYGQGTGETGGTEGTESSSRIHIPPDKIIYNVYGCIHPTSDFKSLEHTTSMTHNCISLFYEHQSTGENIIYPCDQNKPTDIRLHFNHPCYVLFVTGLRRDQIIDIQLVMKTRIGVVDYRSIYDENDITILPVREQEWIKERDRDVLILYFNKRFLEYDQIQDSVNFSQLSDIYLRITKTPPSARRLVDLVVEGYSERKPSDNVPIVEPMHINIFAVNANIMRHRGGMTGFLYKD